MKHVFIIGSRGLPAKYGGFETFVEELVKHQQSQQIKYHVACLSDEKTGSHFDYLGADCFTVNAIKLGPARVMAYDIQAILYSLKLIKEQGIEKPIFYILGNTIGAFMTPLAKRIRQMGGQFYINPDGLEWKRSKWSKPVQVYLKYAEKAMTKSADLVIADNIGIADYIQENYPWSKTRFITYGTDCSPSTLTAQSDKVRAFFDKWQSKENDYYLIVGRFVPENNYEFMIREFMETKTNRQLLIVCNHEGNDYFDKLKSITGFETDKRIKFVGTVYDRDLLTYIRANAYAYLHGHEVGGTNPGLLEALSHTKLNLVLGVSFNQSVAQDTALYWNKSDGELTELIHSVEVISDDFSEIGKAAHERMVEEYSWEKIVEEYEALFLNEN